MNELPDQLTLFSSGEYSPELPDEINREHEATLAAGRKALEHALEAGRLLATVKLQLDHGEWENWLRRNCPKISLRTAQLYMRFHTKRKIVEKAQCVAPLGVTACAKLLAKPKGTKSSNRHDARMRSFTRTIYRNLEPLIAKLEVAHDVKEAHRIAADIRQALLPWMPMEVAV